MNRENILQYLLQMGFDQHKSMEIIESLLKQYTAGGQPVDQALANIYADIQSGGDVYRQLQSIKEASSPFADAEKCPNCGHSRSPEVAGISRPGECAHCGIIFDKFKVSDKEMKFNSPLQSAGTDSVVKSGETNHAAHLSKKQNFFSRHKWITAVIVLVLISLILAPIFQAKCKNTFKESLAAFDQQLKMDSRDEFVTSMDNLKLVIETAAIMVAKHGWSKSDIDWFCKETMTRCDRFLSMINEKTAGQNDLFGFKITDIQDDLGSGMHMLLLSIRNEDARLMALMHSAFSVVIYSPEFKPDQLVKNGAYTFYDPARYSGSSQRRLVRDGKKWILRERSERDKKLYTKKRSAGLPEPAKTRAEIEAERSLRNISQEISLMQFAYRRKHNGACCGNLNELVADHLSIARSKVSQETMDMINSGALTIKVTNEGRSCELVNLRGK